MNRQSQSLPTIPSTRMSAWRWWIRPDANHIAEHTGVCVDGLGPRGDLDHGLDEYTILSSVEECFALMSALLDDLAGKIGYNGRGS